uniref:Lymphocyte antigen 6D-like isoform X2 n=1 Tax=Geotrypetes seraphini TaxID=260995 RepID=A0A6P8PJ00_GEOSA|nr:lymphocyte antigen 6D-like isoform X2 [Geotrypetes seraphini]
MKHLLLAMIVAAGLWNFSTALKCHFCMDAKNDKECNKDTISCGQNKTSCIVSLNVETGLLTKGCERTVDCTSSNKRIKTKCCEEDLCNAKLKVNSSYQERIL